MKYKKREKNLYNQKLLVGWKLSSFSSQLMGESCVGNSSSILFLIISCWWKGRESILPNGDWKLLLNSHFHESKNKWSVESKTDLGWHYAKFSLRPDGLGASPAHPSHPSRELACRLRPARIQTQLVVFTWSKNWKGLKCSYLIAWIVLNSL